MDVHVDPTTDEDEQQHQQWFADPPLEQSDTPSASTYEDRWELNTTVDDDDAGVVNDGYTSPTSSTLAQLVECVE